MGPMTLVIAGGSAAELAAKDAADGEYRNVVAVDSDTMSVASSIPEIETLVPR